MVLYGAGIGDGNRHDHAELPLLLAGRGGGALRPGRHVRHALETPAANLLLALVQRMGAAAETLGDSTGPLDGLG